MYTHIHIHMYDLLPQGPGAPVPQPRWKAGANRAETFEERPLYLSLSMYIYIYISIYYLYYVILMYYDMILYSIILYSPAGPRHRRARKGGGYGWKPSSSSNLSIRAFRAQISQFELFELILLLRLDKRLPVE